MKTPTACRECRVGKRKCTPAPLGDACKECRRRNSPCSFERPLLAGASKRLLLPHSAHAAQAGAILDEEATRELGRLYVALIHDKPHTLFHPPTLLHQIEDGSVTPKVAYGIYAMTARFSENPSVRDSAEVFLTTAIDHLKKDVDSMELETIQACALVGNALGAVGQYQVESLYFGIAFRMAQILDITKASSSDDCILRETKLRVWWSLYMIDRWSSAGAGLPRQILDNGQIPLPMEELQFESLQPNKSSVPVTRPGLWGLMIQLAQIFGPVQDLHRQHVHHHISDSEAEVRTRSISNDLESFTEKLPPGAKLTEDNAAWYAEKGLGSAFVALHLGYHHYSTLLYFHYLDLQLGQTPVVSEYASKCKHHAAAFSDLLKLSTRIPNCQALYFIVAHMTVVSSAALLHTLLFGHQSELEKTRERLKFNFEMLVQLRNYWPAVSQLMDRLFVFQNVCMWSADPNTHKADRWMLRFLLQHAIPVPEKYHDPPQGYTVRDEYADDAMAILKGTGSINE